MALATHRVSVRGAEPSKAHCQWDTIFGSPLTPSTQLGPVAHLVTVPSQETFVPRLCVCLEWHATQNGPLPRVLPSDLAAAATSGLRLLEGLLPSNPPSSTSIHLSILC